jgi:Leucine-rich repeat (LRR) protein
MESKEVILSRKKVREYIEEDFHRFNLHLDLRLIASIKHDAFADCQYMKELNLSMNRLKSLNHKVTKSLSNLCRLDLSSNSLESS